MTDAVHGFVLISFSLPCHVLFINCGRVTFAVVIKTLFLFGITNSSVVQKPRAQFVFKVRLPSEVGSLPAQVRDHHETCEHKLARYLPHFP